MTCPACMGDEETGHLLLPLLTGSIEPSGSQARKVRREAEWLHDLFRMDNGQGDWKNGMR
jgi:hypothetical protein